MASSEHLLQASNDCASIIAEAKRLILSTRPDDRDYEETLVEVEARFGKASDDGKFTGGISEKAFAKIVHALESYTKWVEVIDWTESQDFFYDCGNDKKGAVRTSVKPNTNGLDIKHTFKKVHRRATYRMHMGEDNATSDGLDIRVSCATETPTSPVSLPVATETQIVRIKRRKKFLYASGDTPPMFSFDVSIVWQGQSKGEAEKNQKDGLAKYEVEVECIALSNYLSSCGGDSSCLAMSLLSKMNDFSKLVCESNTVSYIPSNALVR